jgi:fatty acid desaturase
VVPRAHPARGAAPLESALPRRPRDHIGPHDNVDDFRLCCRTFTLNPIVRFLYWHMNYHTEHHMYAAVPCYRLHRLHRMIRHELPPWPRGIVATWREIIGILKKQRDDPDYAHAPDLPAPSTGD